MHVLELWQYTFWRHYLEIMHLSFQKSKSFVRNLFRNWFIVVVVVLGGLLILSWLYLQCITKCQHVLHNVRTVSTVDSNSRFISIASPSKICFDQLMTLLWFNLIQVFFYGGFNRLNMSSPAHGIVVHVKLFEPKYSTQSWTTSYKNEICFEKN